MLAVTSAIPVRGGSSARVPLEGTVPLSEHERRQLEQIEQALRADDPRFADAEAAANPWVHHKRRVIAAALGLVIGIGLLLVGLAILGVWQ